MRYIELLAEVGRSNARGRFDGWRFAHGAEVLLEYGRVFRPELAVPVSEPGPARRCYHNSAEVSVAEGLTYVEGFASSFFPTEHAWCVNEDGALLETTWESVGTSYVGLPVKWKVPYLVIDANEFFMDGGLLFASSLMRLWLEHGVDESMLVDVGEPLSAYRS
ncbi:hypothetical protein [Streptomyces sp. WZ-12]|uniref:hypothetical protein n=1 Tax=Streptomyces sp. WZ-12 TaxID=3030210 RepID=UPI002380FCF0|nr:hypothetical protein [Streptomyces sp. WZ-12]